MPRKTKKPLTVAEVQALWGMLSAADQWASVAALDGERKREFRRRIDKRRSQWDKTDPLMLLVYDLYRERYALPPTRYFKWIGALLDRCVLLTLDDGTTRTMRQNSVWAKRQCGLAAALQEIHDWRL